MSFNVESKTITTTATVEKVQIQSIFVDVQNSQMIVQVSLIDVDLGKTIQTSTITISGSDYTNILNVNNLNSYIASYLELTQV